MARFHSFYGVVFIACALIALCKNATANVTVLQDGSGKDAIGGTILIHSEIKKGDFIDFAAAANRLKHILTTPSLITNPNNLLLTQGAKLGARFIPIITVELDSPGGDVMEAIRIGRLIRERFMDTVVAPERQCASACVLVLMAGCYRAPRTSAHVEIHRPRFDESYFAQLTPDQARAKYNALSETVRKYFVDEMGVTLPR